MAEYIDDHDFPAPQVDLKPEQLKVLQINSPMAVFAFICWACSRFSVANVVHQLIDHNASPEQALAFNDLDTTSRLGRIPPNALPYILNALAWRKLAYHQHFGCSCHARWN